MTRDALSRPADASSGQVGSQAPQSAGHAREERSRPLLWPHPLSVEAGRGWEAKAEQTAHAAAWAWSVLCAGSVVFYPAGTGLAACATAPKLSSQAQSSRRWRIRQTGLLRQCPPCSMHSHLYCEAPAPEPEAAASVCACCCPPPVAVAIVVVPLLCLCPAWPSPASCPIRSLPGRAPPGRATPPATARPGPHAVSLAVFLSLPVN